MNVSLKMLVDAPAPLKNNQRIRLHIHTAEVGAGAAAGRAKAEHPAFKPLPNSGWNRRCMRWLRIDLSSGNIRRSAPSAGRGAQINPFRYRKKFADLFRETLIRFTGDDDKLRILATFDRIS
ncbi:MAG: hypothetical protein R3C26_26390 [Calditrichia bacterium]